MRAVDNVRVLAADAVQKTGNGHPGTAMSLAPVAYLLFQNVMAHDPSDPTWLARDRSRPVLRALVPDPVHPALPQRLRPRSPRLQALRTWGSLTPGHPEVHHTTGVEITTGSLGSGLASAVGMAMAQRRQRACSTPTPSPVRACSTTTSRCSPPTATSWRASARGLPLAGHQELGNLTVVYDANQISIEDDTDISFSEDAAKRYEAYGW